MTEQHLFGQQLRAWRGEKVINRKRKAEHKNAFIAICLAALLIRLTGCTLFEYNWVLQERDHFWHFSIKVLKYIFLDAKKKIFILEKIRWRNTFQKTASQLWWEVFFKIHICLLCPGHLFLISNDFNPILKFWKH